MYLQKLLIIFHFNFAVVFCDVCSNHSQVRCLLCKVLCLLRQIMHQKAVYVFVATLVPFNLLKRKM